MGLPIRAVRPRFDPRQIGADLWLDGADAASITISSGTSVSQWSDKSIHGRHVSQSTAASQPTTTTFNGLGCLLFDGADDRLDNTTSNLTGTGTYTGQFHCFWVATRPTSATAGGTILTERGSALVGVCQAFNPSGLAFISSDGATGASNTTIESTTFDLIGPDGAVVSHSHVVGSRDRFFVNGVERTVSSGTASNISGSTTGFRIGAREAGVGQRWNGRICEVIVLSRTITDNERRAIERYLQAKWKIA